MNLDSFRESTRSDQEGATGVNARAIKPGWGGSAAASVLAVRAACLAQHRRVTPQEILALASAAHWIEQGGKGSGGDVAASAMGGVLRAVQRHPLPQPADLWRAPVRDLLEAPLVQATPLSLPSDLQLIVAWSGEPADSRELIGNVRSFKAAHPGRYTDCIERISTAAEALQASLGAAARDFADGAARESVLDAVRKGALAMAALGEAAVSPIVTAALLRICAFASAAGCAGKPSGAGGGDCAVIFAFGKQARDRALALLRANQIPAFPIAVAARAASRSK